MPPGSSRPRSRQDRRQDGQDETLATAAVASSSLLRPPSRTTGKTSGGTRFYSLAQSGSSTSLVNLTAGTHTATPAAGSSSQQEVYSAPLALSPPTGTSMMMSLTAPDNMRRKKEAREKKERSRQRKAAAAQVAAAAITGLQAPEASSSRQPQRPHSSNGMYGGSTASLVQPESVASAAPTTARRKRARPQLSPQAGSQSGRSRASSDLEAGTSNSRQRSRPASAQSARPASRSSDRTRLSRSNSGGDQRSSAVPAGSSSQSHHDDARRGSAAAAAIGTAQEEAHPAAAADDLLAARRQRNIDVYSELSSLGLPGLDDDDLPPPFPEGATRPRSPPRAPEPGPDGVVRWTEEHRRRAEEAEIHRVPDSPPPAFRSEDENDCSVSPVEPLQGRSASGHTSSDEESEVETADARAEQMAWEADLANGLPLEERMRRGQARRAARDGTHLQITEQRSEVLPQGDGSADRIAANALSPATAAHAAAQALAAELEIDELDVGDAALAPAAEPQIPNSPQTTAPQDSHREPRSAQGLLAETASTPHRRTASDTHVQQLQRLGSPAGLRSSSHGESSSHANSPRMSSARRGKASKIRPRPASESHTRFRDDATAAAERRRKLWGTRPTLMEVPTAPRSWKMGELLQAENGVHSEAVADEDDDQSAHESPHADEDGESSTSEGAWEAEEAAFRAMQRAEAAATAHGNATDSSDDDQDSVRAPPSPPLTRISVPRAPPPLVLGRSRGGAAYSSSSASSSSDGRDLESDSSHESDEEEEEAERVRALTRPHFRPGSTGWTEGVPKALVPTSEHIRANLDAQRSSPSMPGHFYSSQGDDEIARAVARHFGPLAGARALQNTAQPTAIDQLPAARSAGTLSLSVTRAGEVEEEEGSSDEQVIEESEDKGAASPVQANQRTNPAAAKAVNDGLLAYRQEQARREAAQRAAEATAARQEPSSQVKSSQSRLSAAASASAGAEVTPAPAIEGNKVARVEAPMRTPVGNRLVGLFGSPYTASTSQSSHPPTEDPIKPSLARKDSRGSTSSLSEHQRPLPRRSTSSSAKSPASSLPTSPTAGSSGSSLMRRDSSKSTRSQRRQSSEAEAGPSRADGRTTQQDEQSLRREALAQIASLNAPGQARQDDALSALERMLAGGMRTTSWAPGRDAGNQANSPSETLSGARLSRQPAITRRPPPPPPNSHPRTSSSGRPPSFINPRSAAAPLPRQSRLPAITDATRHFPPTQPSAATWMTDIPTEEDRRLPRPMLPVSVAAQASGPHHSRVDDADSMPPPPLPMRPARNRVSAMISHFEAPNGPEDAVQLTRRSSQSDRPPPSPVRSRLGPTYAQAAPAETERETNPFRAYMQPRQLPTPPSPHLGVRQGGTGPPISPRTQALDVLTGQATVGPGRSTSPYEAAPIASLEGPIAAAQAATAARSRDQPSRPDNTTAQEYRNVSLGSSPQRAPPVPVRPAHSQGDLNASSSNGSGPVPHRDELQSEQRMAIPDSSPSDGLERRTSLDAYRRARAREQGSAARAGRPLPLPPGSSAPASSPATHMTSPVEQIARDPFAEPAAAPGAVAGAREESVAETPQLASTPSSDPPRRAPSLGFTDLDLMVSQLERSDPSTHYEVLSTIGEFLGPVVSRSARPEEIAALPVGRVEVERRRITREGKVKQKLAVVGVRVDKCAVCLAQFREDQMACILPCVHIFHEACTRRYLQTARTCPSCRADIGDGPRVDPAALASMDD